MKNLEHGTAISASVLFQAAALSWVIACMGSYYYFNQGYYAEKLSAFLIFFGRFL
jgi:hypothetical protein